MPRSFPAYVRPEQPPAEPSAGQTLYGQTAGSTQWAAPGQTQPTRQTPYGQSTYGQAPYGQAPYGQAPYGQAPYGQAPYGQAPYGQAPYGQPGGQARYGQPGYPGTWPAPYGYGYPAAAGSGTNGLAIAALATGIGGFCIGIAAPVAVGLGIGALVQIRKRHDGGKPMAITGIVLGGLGTVGWLIYLIVMFAIGFSSADDYDASEPASSYSAPSTYVDDLAVGECFDDGDEEDEVVRRPCTEAHDGEIIAGVALPDGPWPGDREVDKSGEDACATAFAEYVGSTVKTTELEWDYWTPTRQLWNADDRLVVCAAYGPDFDRLTDSVKNTRR
ncbi:DUF4190 domain-containing protein [Kribbella turkmenica]|uniref:DUF4190 domain-containing protein n=1 Tax=Kribbella turkmenica TaxID=2530375 RepID=A0A4R4XEF2_9ACTN|nr:DUF4190 domain-containing protein [Kribbella turkmenica]TDD29123.1 DUF4190 domain-containing protein [Kribbella turkmenica]